VNKDRRDVFFVLGSFKLGGTERTAARIGMELIKRGYKVKFLLINGVFDYCDNLLVENSIVLSNTGAKRSLFKIIFVYFKLLKIVWRERPDRLVSFSLGINLLIFFLFYPETTFRVESNIFIYKKRLYRRYLQDIFSRFRHVRRVVIPSKGLFTACLSYFKSNQKLLLISNPLDIENIDVLKGELIDDFPQLDSGRFIVTAGRLHSSKGYEQLIRVYKKSRLYPTIKLLILGGGTLQEELKKLIISEGLEGQVILAGYQRNPYRFMSRARFFVLNSKHESFGNVLIESFACNIPAISNDCDFGPRHIIVDNHNGLLYDQAKEEEFIQKLELLAFNDEVYKTVVEGAVASKHLYDVRLITDQWVEKIIEGSS
jgi:glycosyltransferase involved in cell wall biosynthesis